MAVLAGVVVSTCAATAPAATGTSQETVGGPTGAGDDPRVVGPLLPEPWSVLPVTHWVVGVGLERSSQTLDVDDDVREVLLGASAEFRWRWLGPHARLMVDTHSTRYNERRLFADLGFRAHFPLFGTEASYGVGGHFDARLHRHYWLAGITPVELGIVFYRQGSWRMGLYAGSRVALGGQLLDSFLLDPNGLNNQSAARDLRDARDDNPWEGFLTLVFGRRID